MKLIWAVEYFRWMFPYIWRPEADWFYQWRYTWLVIGESYAKGYTSYAQCRAAFDQARRDAGC